MKQSRLRLSGMDTCFWHVMGGYPLEQRCEMLAELGYDDAYLTIMSDRTVAEDLPRLAGIARSNGLGVMAILAGLNLPGSDGEDNLRRAIEAAAACDSGPLPAVEVPVALKGEKSRSDEKHDGPVLAALDRAAAAAEEAGVDIALYPHIGFWLERVGDALRLARKLDHPRVKISFPAFHWWALEGDNLAELLAEAFPHIRSANLSGARSAGDGFEILPLDQGRLDPFDFLSGLLRHGYAGPLAIQGWNVGGDPYARLRDAKAQVREIEDRHRRHPAWGRVDKNQRWGSK